MNTYIPTEYPKVLVTIRKKKIPPVALHPLNILPSVEGHPPLNTIYVQFPHQDGFKLVSAPLLGGWDCLFLKIWRDTNPLP